MTILLLPGQIRRKSLPELLSDIDSGIGPGPRDEAVMLRTVKITDLLLDFRPLRRYGRCFLRSLTLFKYLRRQGWPVEIAFGVRRADDGSGTLSGHSWLVLNDSMFLEKLENGKYHETFHYPPAKGRID